MQILLLLAFAVVAFGLILIVRHPLIAFVSTFTFGLGLVAYRTATISVMELGGLPLALGIACLGWGAAVILREKCGTAIPERENPKALAWQARRLLVFCLLSSGLIWGISIVFLVLPDVSLASFLRSIGGAEQALTPSVEYASRMVFGVFTLLGFLFYIVASNIEKHFWIIPFLGGLMVSESLVLATVGLRLQPDHPWPLESISCFSCGIIILVCWFRLWKKLHLRQSEPPQNAKRRQSIVT